MFLSLSLNIAVISTRVLKTQNKTTLKKDTRIIFFIWGFGCSEMEQKQFEPVCSSSAENILKIALHGNWIFSTPKTGEVT